MISIYRFHFLLHTIHIQISQLIIFFNIKQRLLNFNIISILHSQQLMNKKKYLPVKVCKNNQQLLVQKKTTNLKNKKRIADPQPNFHKIKTLQNYFHLQKNPKKTIDKYDIMKEHVSKILSNANSIQLSKTLFNNVSHESTTAIMSTQAKSRCKSRKSQRRSDVLFTKPAQKVQLKQMIQQYNSQIIQKVFTLFDTEISNDNKGYKNKIDQIVKIKTDEFDDEQDQLINMIKTERLNLGYQNQYSLMLKNAAVKIQRCWRGYRTRKLVNLYTNLLNNLFKVKQFESDKNLESVSSLTVSQQFKEVNKKTLSDDSLQSNKDKKYNQNMLIKSSIRILENKLMQGNQINDSNQNSKDENQWIDQNLFRQQFIKIETIQSSEEEVLINQNTKIDSLIKYVKSDTEQENQKNQINQTSFSPLLRKQEGDSNIDNSIENIMNQLGSKPTQKLEKQNEQEKQINPCLKNKFFSSIQQLEKLKMQQAAKQIYQKIPYTNKKQKLFQCKQIKEPTKYHRIKNLNQNKNELKSKYSYRYSKKNSIKKILEKQEIIIPPKEFNLQFKKQLLLKKQENQDKNKKQILPKQQIKQQEHLKQFNKKQYAFNQEKFLNEYSLQLVGLLIQEVLQDFKNSSSIKTKIIQFLKNEDILIHRGINVQSSNAINFVNTIINLIYSQDIEIFNKLEVSIWPSELQTLKMVRNSTSQHFQQTSSSIIIPTRIIEQIQNIISKNLITQKEYDHPILEAKRTHLIKKLVNIHNRAIFDAFNQKLNSYRKYYEREPFSWNPIQKFLQEKNLYYDYQDGVQAAKEDICIILQSRCGIHEQKIYNHFGIDSTNYLTRLREDRLNKMLLQYLYNLDEQFRTSEMGLLKIKMEITDMVTRKLIIEMVLEVIDFIE